MELKLIDILSQFGDALLSVVLLGYWVIMLRTDLKDEKNKNETLNQYIRKSDRENIKTLSEFSKFLETLIANMDSMKADMLREVSSSAENVKLRIDNLKTLLEAKNGK
jgi:glycine cleavage system regulatory protein